MAGKHEQNRPRMRIAAILCILLGLFIGFGIKRVHVGLLIGIGLGLLTGSLWSRSSDK
ncbi:hypothetical protein HF324_07600 [Chitinophaga oryzae]|uniref:Uncharacterized protein n=1 Tax=Chitinophaga oryzae TaxID=2725414 RepID=A0AAE6ZGQ9_9BACT|nr:hypothetical protein [Chitinophaga oryzae]QJB31233.1 hypothetical protein HF329_07935 [Chitinophaga oryzae]QJB37721.1 hypothetical protein HF324_07600 [Chitinophaga oryzae]